MTAIILKFIGFLKGLVMFLNPEAVLLPEFFTNINKYISLFLDWIKQINFLVPLPDIMIIFALMLGFRAAYFGIFIVNWLVRRVFDVIP